MSAPTPIMQMRVESQEVQDTMPVVGAASDAASSASYSPPSKKQRKQKKQPLTPEELAALQAKSAERLASEYRILVADSDEEGIWCYQAYKPSIGLAAVERQTFAGIPDFLPNRMTWIKFSSGWMMYRCDYARSKDQEVVLRIKLSWEGLWRIFGDAVGASFDPAVHETREEWQKALNKSQVRFQWDPARDARIEKMPNNQRDLQIGMKDDMSRLFATDPKFILRIENYTQMAVDLRTARDRKEPLPAVPLEPEVRLDAAWQKKLGMIPRAAVAAEAMPADGSASSSSSSALQIDMNEQIMSSVSRRSAHLINSPLETHPFPQAGAW
jgi:hypothetical protein